MLNQINGRFFQKGDTIIEVMIAIAVFSLVAVGGMSIMNQGTNAAQRSLEITLVRQQIDAQAETLRYINQAYVAAYMKTGTYDPSSPAGQWVAAKSHIQPGGASTFGSCSPPAGSFIVNTMDATISSVKPGVADTYSQVVYNGRALATASGIWVEAVESQDYSGADAANKALYVDFHIRACWNSPGQATPMTLGTIVRLYEPRT
jgi:prepilin-type N-terminal cleavage/methylation domain-containing protein